MIREVEVIREDRPELIEIIKGRSNKVELFEAVI